MLTMPYQILSRQSQRNSQPPKLLPILKYALNKPYRFGICLLPSHINPSSPYEIFNLFFDEPILQILVNHTNKYAELHPTSEADAPNHRPRPWYPITTKELRACFATCTWIGLLNDTPIDTFWNQELRGWSTSAQIFKYISKNQWQQIDRFFHISKPSMEREPPFDKLEPLRSHLSARFK